MVPLSFAGEEWLLTEGRALYWPRERALLVADLHLEKGSFFARHGQMIPPYDSRETLERVALAIRETVLPVVLLLGAMAFWRRDWKEGAAWSALAILFAIALLIHLHIIAGLVRPGDPVGPSWLTLRGLQGWIGNVVLSSNLRWLPHSLAGPLVFLMILGWAGWKSPAGRTLTFFSLGYGLAFMIAGRNENFYWGMVVAPAMFAGLAMAPMALRSLWRSAFPSVA